MTVGAKGLFVGVVSDKHPGPTMSDIDLATILARLAVVEAAVGIGHNGGPPLDDDDPPVNPDNDRGSPLPPLPKDMES